MRVENGKLKLSFKDNKSKKQKQPKISIVVERMDNKQSRYFHRGKAERPMPMPALPTGKVRPVMSEASFQMEAGCLLLLWRIRHLNTT